MSRGITLQTKPQKGKQTSKLTYDQVTDPDNYTKKWSVPLELVVDGMAQQPKVKGDVRGLKQKTVMPGRSEPLEDVNSYSEIPKHSQDGVGLRLKTYNGRSF